MATPTAWVTDTAGDRSRVASLRDGLAGAGVVTTTTAEDDVPGVVLVDSDGAGDVVTDIADHGRRQVVVVVDDHRRDDQRVWDLLRRGAADVVPWAQATPARVAARLERWQVVDEVLASPQVRAQLVGDSPAWRRSLRSVVELAKFSAAPILLTGETGTGKELAARLVHHVCATRPQEGMVVVDCTTVVPTLSGDEFFGHERGAYTGATAARDGAFAAADGGTLLLDEVGELPVTIQAELLRVIQEGTYKRLGSNTWRRTTFRLVSATNRSLLSEEQAGRFRRDLYYRLAAGTVALPPLRERRDDVVPLFRHFLGELMDGPAPELDSAVADMLTARDYPGNVRDLSQLAHRVHTRYVGPGPVSPGDVPPEDWPATAARPAVISLPDTGDDDRPEVAFEHAARAALASGLDYRQIRDLASDAAIDVAVADAGGNVTHAAGRLGVTGRALQLRRAARGREAGPQV